MRKVWFFATISALVGVSGCDPSATSSARSPAASSLSSEWESCASSDNCADGLRCVEQTCRSNVNSDIGDYFAGLGRLRIDTKDYEKAIAAFEQAVTSYESAKLKVPPDYYCGQGQALILGGGDPQRAELAARVVHRCMLQAPVGSALRRRAAELLAELADLGLDPQQLRGPKLADEYLKKAAVDPDFSALKLAVSAGGDNKRSSYTRLLPRLGEEDVKQALLPCWQDYWSGGGRGPLSMSLEFKHSFTLDEFDDFERSSLEIVDATPTGDATQDAAVACARAALAPIVQGLAKGRQDETRWQTAIVFVLSE